MFNASPRRALLPCHVREVTQSEDGIDLGPEVISEENMDENPLAAIMDFYRKEVATDLSDPKQNSL